MKWVAEQISSAGYMPGIWTAPFLVDQGSDLVKTHAEWLLRNSKGVLCTFNMNNIDHNILDLTYPGVSEYLEDQYRKISQDWGFRYFKFDFIRSVFLDNDQQFYDKTMTSLKAYRNDRKMLYRHIIPSVHSASRPLDPFNLVCPELMLTTIDPKCKNLGPWKMLSVVNWSNESKDYIVLLDQKITGNLVGSNFLVYDFQSMQIIAYLTRGEKLKISNLGAHQSKVLKIIPWDGTSAMFIGTDLSLSCGGVEISDINSNDGLITGTLDTDWFVPVKLTFVIPSVKGYEIRQIETAPGQREFTFSSLTY